MTVLLSRILGRSATVKPVDVTVYTRAACCCCHKALEVLDQYRARYSLEIHEVDVDSDPFLVEQHGTSVPVVAINGKVRFRGVVNPTLLKRLLEAERR